MFPTFDALALGLILLAIAGEGLRLRHGAAVAASDGAEDAAAQTGAAQR